MPIDPNAATEITAFRWVPPMARGFVKDLRVRWALEEIGQSYRVRRIGAAFEDKPAGYLNEQPFGQVPVYKEEGLTLFESGAILIHVAGKDERLMPRDVVGRARAITWVLAALNSVEPMVQMRIALQFSAQDRDWQADALDAVRPFAETRLSQLSQALGDREWLEDRFTIGDLLMIDVLRSVREDSLLAPHPNLVAYVGRGTARPAFGRAMAAQLADFQEDQDSPLP